MDRRPPPLAEDRPVHKFARITPSLARADVELMQEALGLGVDLEDIKFRPVGGGKNAAYVPADAAV